MSYVVLARRWRPQRFSQLVGQPHVARTILNGLRKGRLAHAYLFCGPRGVGKTTTARLLARAVNCRAPQDGEPCGTCPACVAIAENRFIDVVEVDAASNRGIDEVRQLRESVRYSPVEGKGKVYIIDEVHMLTTEAFNALLKTLEEPPAHAYFCLATTAPQKVPGTILSRCQRFDFRRVPVPEIREHLARICDQDHLPYEPAALDLIARKAEGSVRDALSLLDQVIAYSAGSLNLAETVEVIGEIGLDLFFRALELAHTGDIAAAFRLDHDLAASGADLHAFVTGLEDHLVQVLNLKTAGSRQVDVPAEYRERFAQAAERFSVADLVRLLQLCNNAESDLRRNFSPRVRVQLLLLRFATFERSVLIAEALGKLQERPAGDLGKVAASPLPSGKETAPTPAKPPAPVKRDEPPSGSLFNAAPILVPSASEEAVLKKIQDGWGGICDEVALQFNSRGNMLKFSAFPVSLSGGVLKVNCNGTVHLDSAKSCLTALQGAVAKIAGAVRVELVLGTIPERNAAPETQPNPAVQLLMDRLGARPVE